LSGSLPATLFAALPLYVVNLAHNSLTGELDDVELQDADTLVILNLAGNGLSGTLPSALQRLTRLHLLDVSGNELVGNFSFRHLDIVKYLDVSNNHPPIPPRYH